MKSKDLPKLIIKRNNVEKQKWKKKQKIKKKIIIIFVEGKRVTMRNIKQKNQIGRAHV